MDSGQGCLNCGGVNGTHPVWCPTRSNRDGGELKWQLGALCEGLEITGPEAERTLIEFCKQCPVRMECARYAIDNRIETEIWGGLYPYQRRDVGSGRASLEEALS